MSFYYNANGQRMDMTTMGRCGRDRLLQATQDGYLDPQTVVEMVARWMTSEEIYDMCDQNEVNLARVTGD
jgi:hypothetical protein|tara:strand:- start:2223 stop:2432 length:210 start_codon:yes stop_codon:yes gene_type:complete